MNDYITIGQIIKHYRKEMGLSQEALCEGVCDRKHLSHIENHKVIPTLYIINRLSERLGINLFDTYALMLKHHDIDTHKKIELLNQNYKPEQLEHLYALITEYEQLDAFQNGEPKQILLYGKALYYSNKLKKSEEAIEFALNGLSIHNFSLDILDFKRHYSNVELSLLLIIMVNYCRLERFDDAKKYYNFTFEYINRLFSFSHYATNKNEQFELRFFAKVVYNYFIFYKNNTDFDFKHIDDALRLMKSLHSHCMLPELLLCKAYLQFANNDMTNAKQTYSLAHQLGKYLYTESYLEHLEKSTLETYYHQLTEY